MLDLKLALELQKTLQHLLCSVPAFQIRKFEHVWRQTLSLLPAMRVLPLVLPIRPNLPARRCSVQLPQQCCMLPAREWGGEEIGSTLVVCWQFFLETLFIAPTIPEFCALTHSRVSCSSCN
jgi:hypothetical protein